MPHCAKSGQASPEHPMSRDDRQTRLGLIFLNNERAARRQGGLSGRALTWLSSRLSISPDFRATLLGNFYGGFFRHSHSARCISSLLPIGDSRCFARGWS